MPLRTDNLKTCLVPETVTQAKLRVARAYEAGLIRSPACDSPGRAVRTLGSQNYETLRNDLSPEHDSMTLNRQSSEKQRLSEEEEAGDVSACQLPGTHCLLIASVPLSLSLSASALESFPMSARLPHNIACSW